LDATEFDFFLYNDFCNLFAEIEIFETEKNETIEILAHQKK
jgi:hypothetical protein